MNFKKEREKIWENIKISVLTWGGDWIMKKFWEWIKAKLGQISVKSLIRAALIVYLDSHEELWIARAKRDIEPEKIVKKIVSEIKEQIDRLLPEKKEI